MQVRSVEVAEPFPSSRTPAASSAPQSRQVTLPCGTGEPMAPPGVWESVARFVSHLLPIEGAHRS